MLKINNIYQGNCLDVLKTFPDESINCCMTSPPYWALRDYGVEGQLGLEPTFQEYINKLCDIFDEVKRVLKKDGTCWVNIGDTYYTKSGSSFIDDNLTHNKHLDGNKGLFGNVKNTNIMEVTKGTGINKANELRGRGILQDKSLCNIPARFSIEMQNRGWILRNEIIWHKPNCMPSSVKDRFTVDFEKIFFFVKSKRYYFETQREPHKEESIKRAARGRTSSKLDSNQYSTSYKSEYVGYDNLDEKLKNGELRGTHKDGRNKRAVWTITTKPFKEAHFAVFPEELCETPIKAGCPIGGIVLDPFFGAGTTGVVALKQNKNFIGIELNPEYIKIASKRLQPYLSQTKLNNMVDLQ
jgi:DNA modification methylase